MYPCLIVLFFVNEKMSDSAWAKASERPPFVPPASDSEGSVHPEATFAPDLISNPALREKVQENRVGM